MLSFGNSPLGPRLDEDRSPAEAELLADPVGQLALVGKVQRSAAVDKNCECRRPDGMLPDVENLTLLELQILHETIEFSSGNAPRRRFENFANQRKQSRDTRARGGR